MAAPTSILSNMSSVEDDIKKCRKRIRTIEKVLRLGSSDTEHKGKLEKEISDLKKTLEKQEDSLTSLRHENRRTGSTALFVLVLFVFLFYFTMMLVMQLFLPSAESEELKLNDYKDSNTK